MASIYTKTNKNGSISYYGTLNINGKRHRKLLGYDKKTARTQLSRIEYELKFAPQTPTEEDEITFQKAFIAFAKDVELSGICNRQLDATITTIRKLMEDLIIFNVFNLLDVKLFHLKSFIGKRAKERVVNKYKCNTDDYCPTLSITTLNKDIKNIRKFFRFCSDMKWIKENPALVLKFFKQKDKGERYHFKTTEINLILSKAESFHNFYYLLLHTGIRATDAYKLAPKHLSEGWLSLRMNKTGDRLEMPLREDILELLEPRLHQELIFPEVQTDGQRRKCVKTIQSLFSIDFVRSNNINLHTFRHTYAHTMLNKGVPKEVLQTLLGHRSIRTTEIYANWVRKEELEKWVN